MIREFSSLDGWKMTKRWWRYCALEPEMSTQTITEHARNLLRTENVHTFIHSYVHTFIRLRDTWQQVHDSDIPFLHWITSEPLIRQFFRVMIQMTLMVWAYRKEKERIRKSQDKVSGDEEMKTGVSQMMKDDEKMVTDEDDDTFTPEGRHEITQV